MQCNFELCGGWHLLSPTAARTQNPQAFDTTLEMNRELRAMLIEVLALTQV